MKQFIYLVLMVWVWDSCQSEDAAMQAIATLEATYQKDSTGLNREMLLDAYMKYPKQHPENKKFCGLYLAKAASIYQQQQQSSLAGVALKWHLRDFAKSSQKMDLLKQLEKIYRQQWQDTLSMQVIYRAMQELDSDALIEKNIRQKEVNTYALLEQYTQAQHPKASLAEAYELHGITHLDAPEAADCLLKSAHYKTQLKAYLKATALYEYVYQHFKKSDDPRAKALFTKAFILANYMSKRDSASKEFERFLAEFPEHPLADDAQFMLENKGVRNEMIINQLEMLKDKETF